MKMNKFKDQQEGIKNAKLFYEAVKMALGFQVTYCYHDLIHMIKRTGPIIYMIVTMGGVWDWEQKTKKMEMSVFLQRLKKKKMMKKEKKKKKKNKKKKMMMKLKLLMS